MIIIEECYSLKSYNTFGLPARARFFAEAGTVEDLRTIVNVFCNDPKPKLILGGGSNLLFTDDFDGVVIFPDLKGNEIISQTPDDVYVKAYAGENWDNFVAYCVSQNWGGLENLSLIPGNVGACPIQNIGAYGVEAKDCIDKVDVINLKNGEIRQFTNAECKFGYRDSIFKREAKDQYIVTAVTFKLSKHPVCQTKYADVNEELKKFPEVNLASIRQAIINIRERKLPAPEKFGNAGSFFKNPVVSMNIFNNIKAEYPNVPSYPVNEHNIKIPAAWLIQTCGWKGKREGNVGTHETQPLVIINYGGATGSEIFGFAQKIQQSVLSQMGIELEMEVNIIS
ncbi:MAG: UDP-N-acetylmuramate dehydrogenase [Bacteroidota bacterium]|nr:UDP-N-acetylmuramate dehydrogenase [Bacteroidota bacterium]